MEPIIPRNDLDNLVTEQFDNHRQELDENEKLKSILESISNPRPVGSRFSRNTSSTRRNFTSLLNRNTLLSEIGNENVEKSCEIVLHPVNDGLCFAARRLRLTEGNLVTTQPTVDLEIT